MRSKDTYNFLFRKYFPFFFFISALIFTFLPSLENLLINLIITFYILLGNVYLGVISVKYVTKYSKWVVSGISYFIGFLILSINISQFPQPFQIVCTFLGILIGFGFFFSLGTTILIIDSRYSRFLVKARKLWILFLYSMITSILVIIKNRKSILKIFIYIGIGIYILFTLFIGLDYLKTQYGGYTKLICSITSSHTVQDKVVRIVGGESEGSGFFITPDQVITNFHVIDNEPSPKIIFPDGNFITPVKITGNKDSDLAILYTGLDHSSYVFPLPDRLSLRENDPVFAVGYPLGTDLSGKATLMKGRFVDYRKNKQIPLQYIQTDLSLVEGMSGGPLVDQCGHIVGINTMGLAGLSLFINANSAKNDIPNFTDQNISKIDIDASTSPEKAVEAFYILLKARRLEEGYVLLSQEYLKKTSLDEWTGRFTDVIDVGVVSTEPYEDTKDTVFVKFYTKNWNEGEVNYHYYEGTWQTIFEDGVYKMLQSNIKEITDPDWSWFYGL